MTDPDDLEDDAECTDEDPPTTDDDTCEPEPTTTPADDDTCDPPEEDTAVEDSELPKSNTPQGSRQRLKYYAPNPESLITLGSKTGAGGQDPHGEDGVNIGAADNLNITIGEDTNIYSGRRYVNTGTTVTEVSCDDMAVSSAAKYRLRTDKGVEITAGGTGPALECFDVLGGSTETVEPPKIDTESARSLAEAAGKTMSALWGVLKLYQSTPKLMKNLSKGVEVFGEADVNDATGYAKGVVDVTKGLIDTLEGLESILGGLAYAAGWSFPSMDYLLPGDGSSKVKIHGEGGVGFTSNASIKGVAIRSVGFTAGQKVSLAGGLSFSAKSVGSSSVFGMVGAKLDSWGIVSVGSDHCQVVKLTGNNFVTVASPKGGMKLASKTATTLASEGKIVVKAPKLIMTTNGKGAVMVAGKKGFLIGKEKAVVGSNDKTVVRGKNRVDIESKSGEIHMNAKTPIFISACSDGSKIQMQGHGIAIEKKGGGRASFGNGGVYLSGKQVKAKGKYIFG